MSRIQCLKTGLIYRNPRSHVRSVPSAVAGGSSARVTSGPAKPLHLNRPLSSKANATVREIATTTDTTSI